MKFQRNRLPVRLAARIREMLAEGVGKAEIGRQLEVNRSTVIEHANKWRAETGAKEERVVPAADPKPEPVSQRKVSEEGDKSEVTFETSHPVRTLEDAIRFGEVDTTVWRVAKWECTSWETVTKARKVTGQDEQGKPVVQEVAERHHLWRVWMRLERVISKPVSDAIESVFARHAEKAPIYSPPSHIGGQVLLHFDLMDVHFGKLAWRGETGQDYDLRIAEQVFANAVDDLILEAMGRNVERIILPFGNDYVHTDSGQPTTTSGTLVEVDGRRDKIYAIALMAFIRAIERMMEIAPVDVVRVPGNHDEDSSLTMAWAIKAWFRNAPHVTVDVTPSPRKYRLYGNTLFGYQHGTWLSDAMVKELPAQMLQEAPKEWLGQAEFYEWIIGHQHRERKFTTKDTETRTGTVTRFIHSLSATDAWHHRRGFIGARRAAEVYRHHRDQGYLGHALALARQ